MFCFHGTDLAARAAIDAIGIPFRENGGKSIENGKACAEGAEDFAEEPMMPHGEDDDYEEDGETYGQGQDVRGASDDRPGKGRLHRGHGTEATEIEGKLSGQEDGNRDHEAEKNRVLDESRPSGKGKFDVRDLVEQVLHQAERTRPPAQDSPCHEPHHGNGADNAERHQTHRAELTYHAQGARKDRRRARMAIQHGKTDEMQLRDAQVEQGRAENLHFESQSFHGTSLNQAIIPERFSQRGEPEWMLLP